MSAGVRLAGRAGRGATLVSFITFMTCLAPNVGCSSDGSDAERAVPATDAPELAASEELAVAFELDGVAYEMGCRAIRDSAVDNEVLWSGEVEGRTTTVHPIEGYAVGLIVAVELTGGACSESDPDEPRTPWRLAYPLGVDGDALRDAVCAAGELSAAQQLADGCHLGGPLISCGAGPGFPAWVLDDLSPFGSRSPSNGAAIEALLATDDPAVVEGWHVIVETWWANPTEQLLLRPGSTPGVVEFLVATATAVTAGPAVCEPVRD